MFRCGLGVAISVALALGGRWAWAGEAAVPDTAVTTRDGAVYQGVLVEQVPGSHVSIQTADGKIHRFGVAEVAAVRPLGARAQGASTWTGAPTPAPVQPVSGAGVVVDLAAGASGVRLWQMSVAPGHAPAPNPEVCGPPCGIRVSPGTYAIAGSGIVPSDPFELRAADGRVRIRTEAVRQNQRTTGLILSIGGAVTAGTIGLPFWLAGASMERIENDPAWADSSGPRMGTTFKWTGIVLTVVGAVAAVAGLAVYHGGTRAEVSSESP